MSLLLLTVVEKVKLEERQKAPPSPTRPITVWRRSARTWRRRVRSRCRALQVQEGLHKAQCVARGVAKKTGREIVSFYLIPLKRRRRRGRTFRFSSPVRPRTRKRWTRCSLLASQQKRLPLPCWVIPVLRDALPSPLLHRILKHDT